MCINIIEGTIKEKKFAMGFLSWENFLIIPRELKQQPFLDAKEDQSEKAFCHLKNLTVVVWCM